MYDSFLFIPGNRSDIINKIEDVNADYKIIDFEDSISSNEISNAYNNLLLVKRKNRIFIRFAFFNYNVFNDDFFQNLLKLGFINFVIPKIENVQQLLKIQNFLLRFNYDLNKLNFLLLIETPLALFSIKDILKKTIINIVGLALGSYDYCLEMNMEYSMNNISWARRYLLNISKAFKIKAIDIVSMEIHSKKIIQKELTDSLKSGFDGKLFIHPSQINELNNVVLYSDIQVAEAYKICSLVDINNQNNINVFTYDGKVYEKPLIKKMINIIKWDKKYGKK